MQRNRSTIFRYNYIKYGRKEARRCLYSWRNGRNSEINSKCFKIEDSRPLKGSLLIGGAASYDGVAMSAIGDVVVVTINYRLGLSGCASFGDNGNWCLSDVISALKWVQNNIENFGGDPKCVTLMGYSVGGMMVDALMSSPLSKVKDFSKPRSITKKSEIKLLILRL